VLPSPVDTVRCSDIAAGSLPMNASRYAMRWPPLKPTLPSHAFLEGGARFTVAVERHERTREVGDRRQELRVEPHRFLKRFDRPIVLAEIDVRRAEAVERECLPGIRQRPRLGQLERLVPRLRRVAVVAPRNEEPFALAHAVLQANARRDSSGASAV
jgi:hypothetical protein